MDCIWLNCSLIPGVGLPSALVNNVAINKYLFKDLLSVLLSVDPLERLDCAAGILCLIFENLMLASQRLHLSALGSHQQRTGIPISLRPANPCCCPFLLVAILVGVKRLSICGLFFFFF